MQTIFIHNLGPVKSCKLDINPFTILTGPQASGKSTVAKAIYFMLTVKDEFWAQMTGVPGNDEHHASTENSIAKRLRSKFLSMFGSSWAMPADMRLKCSYSEDTYIEIFLTEDRTRNRKNFIAFHYSSDLHQLMEENDRLQFPYDENHDTDVQDQLNKLFAEPFRVLFIPAGREMITLLSDQLSYIFSNMDTSEERNIDYCTRAYVRQILRLRPLFTRGLDGLLDEKLHLTQEKIDLNAMSKLQKLIGKLLQGEYVYASGEERLQIKDGRYVKINFASSGQQETVWVMNLLYYYALNRIPVYLILEEPESHLYPDAQHTIAKILAMFCNLGNHVMITTHSPYVLGALNNCLYAGELPESHERDQIIESEFVLDPGKARAGFMSGGECENAMADGLIRNELIDGASETINQENLEENI